MEGNIHQKTKLARQKQESAIGENLSGVDRMAKREAEQYKREKRVKILVENGIKTGYRFSIKGGPIQVVKEITRKGEILLENGKRIDPLKLKIKKRKQ